MLISRMRSMIANAGWPSKLIVGLLCVVVSVPLAVRAQPADRNASPRRGWLGLAVDQRSDAESQGVAIVEILAGSPAASAGLRAGDRIAAVNGRPIATYLELSRLSALPPGTVLRLSVRRGNRVRDVAVTLGEPPAPGYVRPAPNGPRATRSTHPPSPSNPYDDDDDARDNGYQSSNGDGYARGNADAGGSCAQVCRRAAECNALSFQRCSKLCTGAAKDGHIWRVDHASCEEVRKAFVTDQWLCDAQASVGSAAGNMPYVYQNKSLLGTGKTRAEAATQALKDCRAIVSNSENLSWLGGESVTGGDCQVARCYAPGTPLNQIPN